MDGIGNRFVFIYSLLVDVPGKRPGNRKQALTAPLRKGTENQCQPLVWPKLNFVPVRNCDMLSLCATTTSRRRSLRRHMRNEYRYSFVMTNRRRRQGRSTRSFESSAI